MQKHSKLACPFPLSYPVGNVSCSENVIYLILHSTFLFSRQRYGKGIGEEGRRTGEARLSCCYANQEAGETKTSECRSIIYYSFPNHKQDTWQCRIVWTPLALPSPPLFLLFPTTTLWASYSMLCPRHDAHRPKLIEFLYHKFSRISGQAFCRFNCCHHQRSAVKFLRSTQDLLNRPPPPFFTIRRVALVACHAE